MGPGSGGAAWLDAERWQATLWESRALRRLSDEARARARATRHQVRRRRSQQKTSPMSVLAQLLAKQETMPVIEQAKGIVMAQQRCGPEEAFALLCRASQRTNLKVHVLATRIVEEIASGDSDDSGGNVTPIALGAARCGQPGTRARSPAG